MILFLAPELPDPPNKGGSIRAFHVLRRLARLAPVGVLALAERADEPPAVWRSLAHEVCLFPWRPRSLQARLQQFLFSSHPDLAFRYRTAALVDALKRLLIQRPIRAIHIEGLEMAWAVEDLLDRPPGARPMLVLDELNAEYRLQERLFRTNRGDPRRWLSAFYSGIQARRLRRYEARIVRRVDRVIAVSEPDARDLEALGASRSPVVAPNGVDTALFHPEAVEPLPLGEPAFVFTGSMDYRPNIDAVEWLARVVWPAVRSALPEAQLYLVGRRPSRAVRRLQEIPGVHVVGGVPDVRPYLAGATVYVAPLRAGGGTRLKILEAMAMGKAIVSTPMGCDGLAVMDKEHVWLADGEAFAAAMIALARDPARRKALGEAARRLAVARYDWEQTLAPLEALYRAEIFPKARKPEG
ncbi:glycosyltransferase [Thermoflexus sp.]|uniref:glycosyltransferase n=1 Tax=Thermoflexus sp. TaxID=1969742 RepID=UPI002ADDDBBB|nr:glycosyltransferase [Thermoflexus sp.]